MENVFFLATIVKKATLKTVTTIKLTKNDNFSLNLYFEFRQILKKDEKEAKTLCKDME